MQLAFRGGAPGMLRPQQCRWQSYTKNYPAQNANNVLVENTRHLPSLILGLILFFLPWINSTVSYSALHFEELISLQGQAVSLDVVLAGMGSYVVHSQKHGLPWALQG